MPLTIHKPPLWRKIQRNNFTNWELLADFLELSDSQRKVICQNPRFPLNLPLRLSEKIQKGTLEDPILKQFLPTVLEDEEVEGYVEDPVGDAAARRTDQLIHKYQGRVLLVCTSACAMHCRYCFRQNFDYKCENKTFDREIGLIAGDSSIQEVILSGGDPLSLSDEVLNNILTKIAALPHVKRIRFHTRFVIGIPERVTDQLLDLLESLPQSIWFVVHVNHPKELDNDIFNSVQKLKQFGVQVLNQSVLLKGVNDDVDTLIELSNRLVDNGIIPYYLHQLDPVRGAAHFAVPEKEGKLLIKEISTKLSGYAVPKYVKEIAGEPGKSLIY